MDGPEVGDSRRSTEREFVQVQFAEDHRPGPLQPENDLGVLLGHAILEDAAGGCRQNASGVDVVLERDRDAMEWPARPAPPEFSLDLTGRSERLLAHDGDERVDRAIVSLDPRQA